MVTQIFDADTLLSGPGTNTTAAKPIPGLSKFWQSHLESAKHVGKRIHRNTLVMQIRWLELKFDDSVLSQRKRAKKLGVKVSNVPTFAELRAAHQPGPRLDALLHRLYIESLKQLDPVFMSVPTERFDMPACWVRAHLFYITDEDQRKQLAPLFFQARKHEAKLLTASLKNLDLNDRPTDGKAPSAKAWLTFAAAARPQPQQPQVAQPKPEKEKAQAEELGDMTGGLDAMLLGLIKKDEPVQPPQKSTGEIAARALAVIDRLKADSDNQKQKELLEMIETEEESPEITKIDFDSTSESATEIDEIQFEAEASTTDEDDALLALLIEPESISENQSNAV